MSLPLTGFLKGERSPLAAAAFSLVSASTFMFFSFVRAAA
jgi:hypothetical protein